MTPIGSTVSTHTRQALQNISTVLDAAGSSLNNIIKATVYLTSMDNYAAHNKVWCELIPDPKPARTCVAVAGLPMGTDVSFFSFFLSSWFFLCLGARARG
jgi:2-iminobutanoate/2-iminopropanoate deaminase